MTTQRLTGLVWATGLAVGLVVSAGCQKKESDQEQGARPTAEQKLDQAQRETEQAYESAKEKTEEARSKAEEAIDTNKEAMEQRQEATQAQQEAEQAQQEAQQAQQEAQQATQSAQERAQSARSRAQQAAEEGAQPAEQEAQQQQPQDQAMQQTGTETAEGTIEEATSDHVIVRREGQPDLRLEVDPQQTEVLLDGQESSPAQLSEGTRVKVSYRTEADQPVAQRIETTGEG